MSEILKIDGLEESIEVLGYIDKDGVEHDIDNCDFQVIGRKTMPSRLETLQARMNDLQGNHSKFYQELLRIEGQMREISENMKEAAREQHKEIKETEKKEEPKLEEVKK